MQRETNATVQDFLRPETKQRLLRSLGVQHDRRLIDFSLRIQKPRIPFISREIEDRCEAWRDPCSTALCRVAVTSHGAWLRQSTHVFAKRSSIHVSAATAVEHPTVKKASAAT